MAFGESLSKREQTLISISVLAIMFGAVYAYFVHLPKRSHLATLRQRVESLEARNARAKFDVADGRIQKLREQSLAYDASLRVMRGLVPVASEVPALLDGVAATARRAGVELTSVEPMPSRQGKRLDTYRFALSVEGDYHAIAGFLADVASLSRIVAPVALNLKSTDTARLGERTDGTPYLDAEIQIQTYVAHARNDGKAAASIATADNSRAAHSSSRVGTRPDAYRYPGRGRRDPFVSLMHTVKVKPVLAALRLVGIVFDATGQSSVAVIRDTDTSEQHRVKLGEHLGPMRVASIQRKKVVFSITDGGLSRQDSLTMLSERGARAP